MELEIEERKCDKYIVIHYQGPLGILKHNLHNLVSLNTILYN